MLRVSTALCILGLAVSSHAIPDLTLLNNAIQGAKPEQLSPSPMDGLYQVVMGSEVYYLSADGRYLLSGELVDLQSQENLTEDHRAQARLGVLSSVKLEDMIIFPAKNERKHMAYVFTDIDCGYCRMLHENIDGYNKLGIEIRYLAFPRAGIGSESYDKAVAVWCSDDRQAALTAAKSGRKIRSNGCAAPVRDQFNLGVSMGVTGTPALILDNGTLVPGFVKPDKLLDILEGRAM